MKIKSTTTEKEIPAGFYIVGAVAKLEKYVDPATPIGDYTIARIDENGIEYHGRTVAPLPGGLYLLKVSRDEAALRTASDRHFLRSFSPRPGRPVHVGKLGNKNAYKPNATPKARKSIYIDEPVLRAIERKAHASGESVNALINRILAAATPQPSAS